MLFYGVDLKDVEEFLSMKGKKLLFYHRDGDGVTSAALIMKFFSGFETRALEGPVMDKRLRRDIIACAPQLICFVDIPMDQEWEKIENMLFELPGTKVLIIDHHIPERNMNSGDVIHLNPRLIDEFKECYIPASCIIYRMLAKLNFDVRPVSWIGAVGVVSDYGMDECMDVIEECIDYNPECGKSENGGSDIFKTKIGKASELIGSAITLKGIGGAEVALRTMINVNKCDDFIKSPVLNEWNDVVRKEIDRLINEFNNKKEIVDDKIIFFRAESKLNVVSILATILSKENPDKIIIIRKKHGDMWKISARSGTGKVNIGEAMKIASYGIGRGGGHEQSGGAMINDWELFRKRFLKYVRDKI